MMQKSMPTDLLRSNSSVRRDNHSYYLLITDYAHDGITNGAYKVFAEFFWKRARERK
jgi:hypothetical protein